RHLITEAVRGEGAYLRDVLGHRFMPDYHDRAELAPRDEVSLLRIINKPPRGISEETVKTLLRVAVAKGKSLWDAVPEARRSGAVSQKAADAVDRFRKLMERFRASFKTVSLRDAARELINAVDYRAELARQYKEENEREQRWKAVEEVVNAMSQYEEQADSPSLAEFLSEVTLDGRDQPSDEKEKHREAVSLMTLHSAKGLEFPIVFLVGLEEGILPHKRSIADSDAAIDEERRLCYVGITRAQDELTISLAKARMKWGKPRPTIPSRFLFELRGDADNPQLLAAQKRAAQKQATGRTSPPKKKVAPPKKKTKSPSPRRSGTASGNAKRPVKRKKRP
ncbi:MAG: exodeoxyribonuclease V subunit gamma, partial [Planctomycetales bacterium]